MKLADVMDEMAARLKAMGGLNVTAYPPQTVSAPAAFPSYPESIEYDQTMGRGTDKFSRLPIWIVFGRVTELATRDKASAWTAGGGAGSARQALDGDGYHSCDFVSVTEAEFVDVDIAGVPYLAAMFRCDVVGNGG